MPTEDKTRSLARIEHLLRAAGGVQSAIEDLLGRRSPIDVLEVGFGHGHALLELAWRFRARPVAFHGVDIGYKSPIKTREDLLDVVRAHEIVPAEQLAVFTLPYIDFYDATQLRFADESLDLVFTAVTIRFMRDKARHIEEVCRVLRPGGRAILHLGESNWDYPSGKICGDRLFTPYTSRLVLKHHDELVPLPEYMSLFEGDAFHFAFTRSTRCILCVDKLASASLSLHLDYDDERSMGARKVPLRNRNGEVRGGFRSVYDVRTPMYERLVASRLAVPA
jgi:SAM-dependent methyltransferase